MRTFKIAEIGLDELNVLSSRRGNVTATNGNTALEQHIDDTTGKEATAARNEDFGLHVPRLASNQNKMGAKINLHDLKMATLRLRK